MLFTFPSRYSFTIGLPGVFSLAGWSRRIRAEFLVIRVTQDTTGPHLCSCKGLSPATVQLSRCFHSTFEGRNVVLQPPTCIATRRVWALPRSLATTGGIIVYFLFLEVLRCFSSLGSPHRKSSDDRPSDGRVVPFGNPRIKGHLHLRAAYRSLSRPSSPPGAKASTRRPNSFSPLPHGLKNDTPAGCSYFLLYS